MANNPGGAWNKFLNFVGLVDDDQDPRSQNYSSDNYGRQEAYRPSRQRKDAGPAPRKNISEKGGRSNYGTATRRSRPDETAQTGARRSSRFEEDVQEPFNPQRAERSRSRFEEPAEQPRRAAQRTSHSSDMLVVSLFTLYDTRAVIKALVKGHTITVSIEAKDSTESTRITDTLSGAAFALDGDFRQVGHNSATYLLTPKSVNIVNSYDTDDAY